MLRMVTAASVLAMTAGLAQGQMAPAQGGALTVPIVTTTFVADFNPFSNAQEDLVRGTMFEPLWFYNAMSGEVVFRLATGFEYSDDLTSLTITLRDDLTWSDGEVLDAEDVAYSIALGQNEPTLDKTGLWAGGKLASVEAVDAQTVVLRMAQPDATIDWYMDLAYIVPEHIWSGVEDKISFKNENPVGSGPITEVTSFSNNQIEICRNPHYYKADEGLPYLDCIKFRQYSDNSQLLPALINDEIDWGANFVADVDATYVARNPETHGYWYPANDLINIYLNTRQEPFSDLAFRQAFSMALDRPLIVDLAAYGYPTPADNVTGLGTYYAPYFNAEVNAQYDQFAQYNPDAAAALLDEAGYKDVDGDGFRESPSGAEIDFDIHVVNGWTDWVQSVQMVSEALAEIGIKGNVRPVDWSVYDSALKEGSYEASINWSLAGVDPILAYREYFHPDRVGQSWHAGHGMASEEMGALIDEYGQIQDAERRSEILAELMHYTGANLPFIPVFSNPIWYQYNTTRIEGWPTEADPYVQPVFYSIGPKLMIFERLHQK